MPSILILALPVVLYVSLCSLPRGPGSLYTIGTMFVLVQLVSWLGLVGSGGAAVLAFAQLGIVMAGLVQGLRLMVLPAEASRGRYLALIFGGLLIGAALLRSGLGF
jgi:hypothetical protein